MTQRKKLQLRIGQGSAVYYSPKAGTCAYGTEKEEKIDANEDPFFTTQYLTACIAILIHELESGRYWFLHADPARHADAMRGAYQAVQKAGFNPKAKLEVLAILDDERADDNTKTEVATNLGIAEQAIKLIPTAALRYCPGHGYAVDFTPPNKLFPEGQLRIHGETKEENKPFEAFYDKPFSLQEPSKQSHPSLYNLVKCSLVNSYLCSLHHWLKEGDKLELAEKIAKEVQEPAIKAKIQAEYEAALALVAEGKEEPMRSIVAIYKARTLVPFLLASKLILGKCSEEDLAAYRLNMPGKVKNDPVNLLVTALKPTLLPAQVEKTNKTLTPSSPKL